MKIRFLCKDINPGTKHVSNDAKTRIAFTAEQITAHLLEGLERAIERLAINNIEGSEQPFIDELKEYVDAATEEDGV